MNHTTRISHSFSSALPCATKSGAVKGDVYGGLDLQRNARPERPGGSR